MLIFCDDVNFTPSSTPGPARLPSPPSVQQKLLSSREKLPQSVTAAVCVEDHKACANVPAAFAVCVIVSAASANALSVITMSRTRTSIPSLARPARTQTPSRNAATGQRHVRAPILIPLVGRSSIVLPCNPARGPMACLWWADARTHVLFPPGRVRRWGRWVDWSRSQTPRSTPD
jgi:hypothetical protein